MQALSDFLLKETYSKAIELNLDRDFILMLEEELSKRTTDQPFQ